MYMGHNAESEESDSRGKWGASSCDGRIFVLLMSVSMKSSDARLEDGWKGDDDLIWKEKIVARTYVTRRTPR